MTTDEFSTDQSGTTSRGGVGQELAEQYWATVARTADLVRKLTALADRYETAIRNGDVQAAGSRPRVALMRSTAEAGRRLIRSLAPPAAPSEEQLTGLDRADQARGRDAQAAMRDAAAQARDGRAKDRDALVRAVAADEDVDWAGRFLAACDRDLAAGDRADALSDRRAAQADRELAASRTAVGLDGQARAYALLTHLEERAMVRQAQGVLMQRAGLTAAEAFEALLLAAVGPMTLDGVADHVIRRAELPTGQDVT